MNNVTFWTPLSSKFITLIVTVLVVLPVILNQYPPLNDYPWHLARMIILSDIDNPVYSEFYKPGSFLLPNLAMSMVTLPLAKIIGVESASRFFVALSLLSMLFGTMMLHKAVHKRFSPWPLLTVVLLFNGIFYYGFLNYIFGMGAALFATGTWLYLKPNYLRHIFTFVMSLILILLHFSSFGIFAVIVGSFELYRVLIHRRALGLSNFSKQLFLSAVPFLLALGVFIILSPTSEVASGSIKYSSYSTKAFSVIYSILTGITWLNILFWGSVIIIFTLLIFTKSLLFCPRVMFAFFILSVVFILLPSTILEVHFVDHRLGPAIALLGVCVFDVKSSRFNSECIIVSLALLLAAATSIGTTLQWNESNNKISDIVHTFKKIESGATIFSATAQPYTRLIRGTTERKIAWNPPLKHVASFAVLSGPKFVPMTFVHPTMQPLNITDKYDDIKQFQGDNPRKTFSGTDLEMFILAIKQNMENGSWPQIDNAYLFVMGFDRIQDSFNIGVLSDWIYIVDSSDDYILFKLSPKGT